MDWYACKLRTSLPLRDPHDEPFPQGSTIKHMGGNVATYNWDSAVDIFEEQILCLSQIATTNYTFWLSHYLNYISLDTLNFEDMEQFSSLK